ncbi:MAG: hypothetical protein K2H64_02260 [Desulfovibrio sp.]|nr:hypothetical protein [Desulfovibrio sp.]
MTVFDSKFSIKMEIARLTKEKYLLKVKKIFGKASHKEIDEIDAKLDELARSLTRLWHL